MNDYQEGFLHGVGTGLFVGILIASVVWEYFT